MLDSRLPMPGRVNLVEGRYLPDTGPSSAGWHSLAEAGLCLQKWAGRHLLGLSGPPRDYLTRGTMLHAGIGAHYLRQWAIQKGQDPEQFWDPQEAVRVQAHALEDRLVEAGADHEAASLVHPVQQAVWAYVHHYAARDLDRYEILGVELEMTARIADEQAPLGYWPFSRGVDLVVFDRLKQAVVLFDHKGRGGRSARIESMYEHDLTMAALWKFGAQYERFGGVVLNYVTVPKVGKRDVTVHMERVEAKRAPWLERQIGPTIKHYRRLVHTYMGADPWDWPKAQIGAGACVDVFGERCFMLDYCRFGPPRTAQEEP